MTFPITVGLSNGLHSVLGLLYEEKYSLSRVMYAFILVSGRYFCQLLFCSSMQGRSERHHNQHVALDLWLTFPLHCKQIVKFWNKSEVWNFPHLFLILQFYQQIYECLFDIHFKLILIHVKEFVILQFQIGFAFFPKCSQDFVS